MRAETPGELDVRRKTSVSDLVSAADHAAEALIAERLRAARPGDGLVGEEGARSSGTAPSGTAASGTAASGTAASGAAAGSAARTWFVDPVDGTYNFLAGLPFWCSAVALAAGSDGAADPVLGAVYQPATDELWLGGGGQPATYNGVPVARLAERPLRELSLASYLHPPRITEDGVREPLLRVAAAAATLRMLGSGSIELASVASGRLGAWLQLDTLSWDWLPGAALVRAAGGTAVVLEAHGHRWHAAGNARAVAEITEMIRRS
jgi:fructose-1,6-bisphosphatase/inositol monophosphatase family enzyme